MRYVFYFDCLRILAALAVVVLHVVCAGWNFFKVDTISWQVINLVESLVRWCVPMFVMISGALFLNPQRSISVRDIYLKYCFRIVIIIGLWMIMAFGAQFTRNLYHDHSLWKSIVVARNMTEYPPGISWYLYMLLGLYTFVPVLRSISTDKKILLYIMCYSFGINAIIFFGSLIPSSASAWILQHISQIELYRFQGYIGYFCAGMYFNTYINDKKTLKVIYFLGIIGALITVIGTSLISVFSKHPTHIFYDFLCPNVACMTIALFLWTKNINVDWVSDKVQQTIGRFSRATLLIYFVHWYIIDGLRVVIGLSVVTVGVIYIPIIVLFAFTLSLGLAIGLLKIKLIKRIFG